MAYIVLNSTPVKIKSISRDPQLNIVNKGYVGASGSYIKSNGSRGRKIELTVLARKTDIAKIEAMEKLGKPIILTSESEADYNGQYYLTGVTYNEGKKGIWSVSITLLEYVEANVAWTNFEKWNVSSSGSGAAGEDTTTTNPLQGCPTLAKGDRSTCVGELQTFLKLFGYYVYTGHVLDVDNYFGQYTESAVKAFQTDHGLTPTGIVDPETRAKMTL